MSLPKELIEELIDGLSIDEGFRHYDIAIDAAIITARYYAAKPSRPTCVRCERGEAHTWHRSK